jgi:hypothetical protein
MAQSRFNVEVTEGDIGKANVGDSYKCVVAQAIARQIPNARRIEVDLQTIRWSDEDGRHVFLTPYSVAGYIVAFDAGDELHPFRFQLRDAIPAKQKRPRSNAAKAVKDSRGKVRNERRRQKEAAAVVANPAAPPDKVAMAEQRLADAPERIAAAESAHEDLKAAYREAGESFAEERISETARAAPPKVYKTKRQEYGQRVLRVNQAEDRKHYA